MKAQTNILEIINKYITPDIRLYSYLQGWEKQLIELQKSILTDEYLSKYKHDLDEHHNKLIEGFPDNMVRDAQQRPKDLLDRIKNKILEVYKAHTDMVAVLDKIPEEIRTQAPAVGAEDQTG